MALNPIPVANSIATIVSSTAPAPGTPITPAQLQTMWQQIMTAIYSDIAASAQVTVVVASVAGVTPGGGVSGPGAGTGTIT